ncbi:hypothetical protein [Comamonas sp. JC664]|uniref:hypothetical protein n=1 Tax=Comamonas sp. JC664 TaxID=2801917 RepID=UPI00174801B2|nr:hypothetical protein [Comamonas sp. JC664]MBL0697828.1 hypothetical protein [Comamonas sp. JC664]GHG69826.1 hypothetical protein GCM10012319_14240 [Comamonas sp. KCTC 72670]
MDYRKFLGQVESVVLPYLGGGTVDSASRRLRVTTPVSPGWWRFEVKGRDATPREPAEPEGLDTLPRVRGHSWGRRLVREGAVAEPLELMPEEEPPRLAPVSARRWHDGTLLFDSVDFEGEAEGTARIALEEAQPLGHVPGVSAPLRAAFGYALLERVSRDLDIRFAPAEVRGQILAVAEGGRVAAEDCLRRLSQERAAQTERLRQQREAAERRERSASLVTEAQRRVAHLEMRRGRSPSGDDGMHRAERALLNAGARPLDQRRLEGQRLEVTYAFMGERFVSIVAADSLQVLDAGICLAGADENVTLESLPSVIREAIETNLLVVTRHV